MAESVSSADVLWPDPELGPWYVRLDFTEIDGMPQVTGLVLRSHVDPDDLREAQTRRLEATVGDVRDRTVPDKPGRPRPQPAPVTAQLLRELRFGERERQARHLLRRFFQLSEGMEEGLRAIYRAKVTSGEIEFDVGTELEQNSKAREKRSGSKAELLRSGPRPTKPGRKIDHERLMLVAEVYNAAITTGDPTGFAVGGALGVSDSRASALVGQARKHGYLPETTKGKARGGLPSDKNKEES